MSGEFANTLEISGFRLRRRVRCFCPMGNDWYSADVDVAVASPELIPDYVEIDRYFSAEVDGKSLILEEVCANVWDEIKAVTGEASDVRVTVKCDDAVHMPVIVYKN